MLTDETVCWNVQEFKEKHGIKALALSTKKAKLTGETGVCICFICTVRKNIFVLVSYDTKINCVPVSEDTMVN